MRRDFTVGYPVLTTRENPLNLQGFNHQSSEAKRKLTPKLMEEENLERNKIEKSRKRKQSHTLM